MIKYSILSTDAESCQNGPYKENLSMYYVEFDKFYLLKTLHPHIKGCLLNYNEVHAFSIISMTKLKSHTQDEYVCSYCTVQSASNGAKVTSKISLDLSAVMPPLDRSVEVNFIKGRWFYPLKRVAEFCWFSFYYRCLLFLVVQIYAKPFNTNTIINYPD